ncbi:MAG: BLUF domain-containing protein [Verrucomicrobiota bacterium]
MTECNPLYQIIYISAAVHSFAEHDLEELLRKTQIKNKERGITGIILYVEGNIIQIIEGEKTVVKALFTKIESDPRHRHVILMAKQPISKRDFPMFSMGFKPAGKEEFDDSIPGFLDAVARGRLAKKDLEGLSNRVKIFLTAFAATTKLEMD